MQSVQSLCKLLSTIEPLMISETVLNLKQTTQLLLHATCDERLSDISSPTVDSKVCYKVNKLLKWFAYSPLSDQSVRFIWLGYSLEF